MLDVSFGEEGDPSGVYHSRYDTFEHHTRFVDPGFVYDALLAKTIGRVVLRVADSEVPVQRESDFADAVSNYLVEVKKLADDKREAAETQAGLLRDRAFQLAADLKLSARAYDDALAKSVAALSGARLTRVQILMSDIDQKLAFDAACPAVPGTGISSMRPVASPAMAPRPCPGCARRSKINGGPTPTGTPN